MRDKVGESKEDWSWRLTPHSFGDLQVSKKGKLLWEAFIYFFIFCAGEARGQEEGGGGGGGVRNVSFDTKK